MNFFENIGLLVVTRIRDFWENLAFFGEALVSFFSFFLHPRSFRIKDFALAFKRASFDGLPISSGIGFLLGLILAFQSAAILQSFGAETFVANMLSIALFRELGPLVTAIILAGRSGSAFAAEIGTMKVDEELDALSTMGLAPIKFLVWPRVLAAVVAMPILTIFAELSGLLGGAIVLKIMGIPHIVYWRNVIASTTVYMILSGLVKSCLFGSLVGLIGCSAGMRTRATSDGVGVSATSAVVGGIIAIAVTDGILAVLTYLWKV